MKQLTLEQQALLVLIRRSLWGETLELPVGVNWERVDTIAGEQAMVPFAYDGAVGLKAEIPAEILQAWKNKTILGVARNQRLMMAQDQLLAWFSRAGIPALILKGSSVARYYPQSDLRILGDIDVLVRKEDLEKAKDILMSNGYVYHDHDHGFHIGLSRNGVYVELHHNVTGFPDSDGGRVAQQESTGFLAHIAQASVSGYGFPVLSEPHQALTLILHMIRHMFLTGIGLRQMYDWAMYVAETDDRIFAEETLPLLERCGLLQYAKVATKTCVCHLGLGSRHLGWCADADEEACRAFMGNVFSGGNMGSANKEGMGSLFTDSGSMGKKHGRLRGLIASLTQLSYQRFPITKKYKMLLPFFWVFIPARYWVRSKLGLRPKKTVANVMESANQQRNLYEMLRPFERDA